MNRAQFLIGLVVIAVIALGVATYFVFAGPSNDTGNSPFAVAVRNNDRTLGSPKASLVVLEYASPTCPVCARFDTDVFPQFKQQYIDTGKAFFIFRVFPRNAPDIAAELMARSLPESAYFPFIDLLYRNQAKWDPEFGITDVHSGLVEMGRIAGMTAEKVDAAIRDEAKAKSIEDVGMEAATKYGVSGTPTFVIHGQIHGTFADFKELREFLDPLLAGR